MLKGLRIRMARGRDIPGLLTFFIRLDRDLYARKFYRAYRCDGLNVLLSLLSLTYALLICNNLRHYLGRFYIFVVLWYRGSCAGVCHISVRKQENRLVGSYGIAIDRAFRGRGLGLMISRYALLLARKLGVERVYLRVDTDNSRAIKLYRSLGFRVCGRTREFRYFTDSYVDQLVMKLELTAECGRKNHSS